MIKFMDGTIQQTTTDTIYDWSACNSSGPFTLAPTDTFTAAFAILGGDNLSDLQENADTAYNRYWGNIGTEEWNTASLANISLYPAISHGKAYTIAYSMSVETPVHVKVYNAVGQLLKEQDFGRISGAGELKLDISHFAQGVYFAQIEYGNTKQTSKIIWLK